MTTKAGKFPYYTKVVTEAMDGLSLEERGLYQYMKSQKEDWLFHMNVMAKQIGCSLYKIRKNLKKLIEKGLIERIQTRLGGLLGYIYKLRDKKGAVKDDVVLMNRKSQKEPQEIEATVVKPTSVITQVETEVKEIEVQKVEDEVKTEEKKPIEKNWRALFEGKEHLIEKFTADRKRHLTGCDYYKKLGRPPSDSEVENHIKRKINDENSDMEIKIQEFIARELKQEQAKEKLTEQLTVSPAKKIELEMKEVIRKEIQKLSQERFPDLWQRENTLATMREIAIANKMLSEEIKEIELKYETIYKPLIEKAQNE